MGDELLENDGNIRGSLIREKSSLVRSYVMVYVGFDPIHNDFSGGL